MSKVKKQHYVPQFYLRLFADSDEQLYVWDKLQHRSFRSSVRDVANEKYFYDLGQEVMQEYEEYLESHPERTWTEEQRRTMLDPQSIENTLTKVEHGFADLLRTILQEVAHHGGISVDQKEQLAYYLAGQMLRTPRYRQTLLELHQKVPELVSQLLIADKFGVDAVDSVKVTFDKKYGPLTHARAMFDAELNGAYIGALLGHVWLIGKTDQSQTFYTSDHPIVMRSHLNQPFFGVGSPGVEVCFPLSPEYVLTMRDRHYFQTYAGSDRSVVGLDPDNVTYFNSLQVFQSSRHVFCARGQLTLAAEIYAAHPETSEPRGDMIRVEALGKDLIHVVFGH